MARPRREFCRNGGHPIKTRSNGSRYCPQCAERKRRERRGTQRKAEIYDELGDVMLALKGAIRVRHQEGRRIPPEWEKVMARLEAEDAMLAEGHFPNMRRKRVLKVKYRDERLCEGCRERLFPAPDKAGSAAMQDARRILNSQIC
jgi:hypothetical protein